MSLSEEKGRELVLAMRNDPASHLFANHACKPWYPCGEEAEICTWLAKATVAFLPRSIAETNTCWRHFCTYMVLRDGDRVFAYRRSVSGGEDRLHGLLSLGVGGHVGLDDYERSVGISARMLEDAALREVDEELAAGPKWDFRLAGLIADDSTPVNRVHLGAVYTVSVDRKYFAVREDCLADPQWLTVAELRERRDEMEVWSRIVLDRLLTSGGGRS